MSEPLPAGTRASRLARRLVRAYPPAWRERYQDEIVGLIDETECSWRMAVDLAGGAVYEWAHAVVHPAGEGDALQKILEVRKAMRWFGAISFALVLTFGAPWIGSLINWPVLPSGTEWWALATFVGIAVWAFAIQISNHRARRQGRPGAGYGREVGWFELGVWSALAIAVSLLMAASVDDNSPSQHSTFSLLYAWFMLGKGMLDATKGARLDARLDSLTPGRLEAAVAGDQARRAENAETIIRFYNRTPPPEDR
jgi:hypothetical protein